MTGSLSIRSCSALNTPGKKARPLPSNRFSPRQARMRDAPARRRLLIELIKIDLHHRWRIGLPLAGIPSRPGPAAASPGSPAKCGGPLLENYVARFPELGAAEQLPPDLVAEEYGARRVHGEPPHQAEYELALSLPGRPGMSRVEADGWRVSPRTLGRGEHAVGRHFCHTHPCRRRARIRRQRLGYSPHPSTRGAGSG